MPFNFLLKGRSKSQLPMYTQILVFMLLIKCIFSISIHTHLCLIYMKKKVTNLCCEAQITVWEALKLVLSLYNDTFRQNPKPSHLKQDSTAICSNVISVYVIRLNISVNSICCVNPWTHACKAQPNICNKLPNKSRESHCYLLMSFSFIWGIRTEIFQVSS